MKAIGVTAVGAFCFAAALNSKYIQSSMNKDNLRNVTRNFNAGRTNRVYGYKEFAKLDNTMKTYIMSIPYEPMLELKSDVVDITNINKQEELNYLIYMLGLQANIFINNKYIEDYISEGITEELKNSSLSKNELELQLNRVIGQLKKLGTYNNIDVTISKINTISNDFKIYRDKKLLRIK